MRYFSIKRWNHFQHYRDRRPTWIKLHVEWLDDYEFGRLQDASKLHLFAIMLLASRHENRIPYDSRWIATKINATTPVDLEVLEKAGFIELEPGVEQNASDLLASCYPRDRGRGRGRDRDSQDVNHGHEDSKPIVSESKIETSTVSQPTKSTESKNVLTIAESIAAKAGKTAEVDRRRVSGWIEDVQMIQTWVGEGFTLAEIESAAASLIGKSKNIRALWPFLKAAMPEELRRAKSGDTSKETQRLMVRTYFATAKLDAAGNPVSWKARHKSQWRWMYAGAPPLTPGSDVPDDIALEVARELNIVFPERVTA